MNNKIIKRKSNRLSTLPAVQSTDQERRPTRQTKKVICNVIYEKDDSDYSIDKLKISKPELKLRRVKIPSTLNKQHLNVSGHYNSVNDESSLDEIEGINKNKLVYDRIRSKNSQNNKHKTRIRNKRLTSKNNISSSHSDNESFDDTNQNLSFSDVIKRRQTRGSNKLIESHSSHLRSPKKDYTKYFESDNDSDDNVNTDFFELKSNGTGFDSLHTFKKENNFLKQSSEKNNPKNKTNIQNCSKLDTTKNAISAMKKSNDLKKNSIMNYIVPLKQKEKSINETLSKTPKEDLTISNVKIQKQQKNNFKRKSLRRKPATNRVEILKNDEEIVSHTPPLPSKLNGYQIDEHSFSAKVSRKRTTCNIHHLTSLTTPRKREKRVVKRPSRFLSPPKIIKTRCKSLSSSFGKFECTSNQEETSKLLKFTESSYTYKQTKNDSKSVVQIKPSTNYCSTMKKVGIRLKISRDEILSKASSNSDPGFDGNSNESNANKQTKSKTENIIPKKRKAKRSHGLCTTPGCDSTGHRYGKYRFHYKEYACPILHPSKKKRKLLLSPNISIGDQNITENNTIFKISNSVVTTIGDILADIPSDCKEFHKEESERYG